MKLFGNMIVCFYFNTWLHSTSILCSLKIKMNSCQRALMSEKTIGPHYPSKYSNSFGVFVKTSKPFLVT